MTSHQLRPLRPRLQPHRPAEGPTRSQVSVHFPSVATVQFSSVVDSSRAGMAQPAAAHARRGVLITGYPGAGEKRGGGRTGDSRSPRERPRRSATEPAPAGRPRSPRLHHMLLYLSAQGQRSKMHSACSRCDSYMKGFQPSRRDAAPDCLGDHRVRGPGSGRSGDWPAEALTLAASHRLA